MSVTCLWRGGTTLSRELVAGPNSRTSIWLNPGQFDGVSGYPLADESVSTTVETLNGVAIAVPGAM